VAATGGERGLLDSAALVPAGRLAVLGSKATADPQLPLRAPDCWFRVAWHPIVKSLSASGYFREITSG
jgi:hypothetical protein